MVSEIASKTSRLVRRLAVLSKHMALYGVPSIDRVLVELDRRGIGCKQTILMALPTSTGQRVCQIAVLPPS